MLLGIVGGRDAKVRVVRLPVDLTGCRPRPRHHEHCIGAVALPSFLDAGKQDTRLATAGRTHDSDVGPGDESSPRTPLAVVECPHEHLHRRSNWLCNGPPTARWHARSGSVRGGGRREQTEQIEDTQQRHTLDRRGPGFGRGCDWPVQCHLANEDTSDTRSSVTGCATVLTLQGDQSIRFHDTIENLAGHGF